MREQELTIFFFKGSRESPKGKKVFVQVKLLSLEKENR